MSAFVRDDNDEYTGVQSESVLHSGVITEYRFSCLHGIELIGGKSHACDGNWCRWECWLA